MKDNTVTSDSRQADVDEAERLLAEAESTGDVALPSLLAIDLITVGGVGAPIVDPDMWTAWSELDPEARATATVGSITSLGLRGLLDVAASTGAAADEDGRVDMPMRAPLALILGARAKPTAIAVRCPDAAGGDPVRVYGFGDTERPLRACVVETVTRERVNIGDGFSWAPNDSGPASPQDLNRLYQYRLQSLEYAATDLAAWAIDVAATPADAAWPPPRVIEILRHDPDRPATLERLSAEGDGFAAMVTQTYANGRELPPVRLHQSALAKTIAELMLPTPAAAIEH
jgi:hypothetical protein